MAQQWVDITTIDNSTPFSAVRWLPQFNIDNQGALDIWFSETPGLTTDGMDWGSGDWNYGSFGAHRINNTQYTCAFNSNYKSGDGTDVTDDPGMGYAVRDADRNVEYDDTIVIGNETYYEVDFSTWDSYIPLYYPFTGTPVQAGSIYVLTESQSPINGNKDTLAFPMSGGTDNSLEITCEKEWTADTQDNWISVAPIVGPSGTTAVTVTVSDNTARTRTGGVEFAAYVDGQRYTFDLTVNQDGYYGVTSDTTSMKFKASGESKTFTLSADSDWRISFENTMVFSASPWSGNSGVCAVTVTCGENTGDTRFDDMVLRSMWNSQYIYVEQRKPSSGFGGVILGDLEVEAMYLGDVEVEGLFLGDIPIAEAGPPSWKVTPSAITTNQYSASTSIKVASPTGWTIDTGGVDWITVTPSAGTSGRTTVAVEIDEYTGNTSRNVTLTAMTVDSASSATCEVTQNYVSGLTVPHLVNFNAKEYNPVTNTIPNSVFGTLPYDLELTGAVDAYDSSSITVSHSYGQWEAVDAASNPFNSPTYLTIIAKTDNYAGGYIDNSCLVANRDSYGYNWMVKQNGTDFFLHTSSNDYSQLPYVTANTQPNIWAIVVGPNNGQEVGYGKSYTDNVTGNVEDVTYGAETTGIGFLKGFFDQNTEIWEGKLYWLFISNSYLSGADVQAVIDYNENL